MVQPVLISIAGTLRQDGEEQKLELVTEGSYCYEPGLVSFSYEESQMTGLEGVISTFTVEQERTATLRRTGKLNSCIEFSTQGVHESLYDVGFAAMMLRVRTLSLTALFNEHGGVLDLEYAIELENTTCGVNAYHIEVRPQLS